MSRKVSSYRRFTAHACAKVNIFLHVLGKRDDGYHNIRSLLVPVSLYDTLTITADNTTSLHCNQHFIPRNHKNIILKTDKILRDDYGFDRCFKIDLIKRIPTGAGLGGGSSDAATYLKLAMKASGIELPFKEQEDIMRRVGSDTVFFLKNRPAIVSGRGDILEDFDFLPKFFILLINPQIFVSTKEIYSHSQLAFTHEKNLPNITSPLTFQEMTALMKNDMEVPAFNMYDSIKVIVDKINAGGRGRGLMSGSGSTVFGVYESQSALDEDYEVFKAEYPSYFIKKVETVCSDGGEL